MAVTIMEGQVVPFIVMVVKFHLQRIFKWYVVVGFRMLSFSCPLCMCIVIAFYEFLNETIAATAVFG